MKEEYRQMRQWSSEKPIRIAVQRRSGKVFYGRLAFPRNVYKESGWKSMIGVRYSRITGCDANMEPQE